jgi:hypothetical protein
VRLTSSVLRWPLSLSFMIERRRPCGRTDGHCTPPADLTLDLLLHFRVCRGTEVPSLSGDDGAVRAMLPHGHAATAEGVLQHETDGMPAPVTVWDGDGMLLLMEAVARVSRGGRGLDRGCVFVALRLILDARLVRISLNNMRIVSSRARRETHSGWDPLPGMYFCALGAAGGGGGRARGGKR